MRMLDLFSGIGGFALSAKWVWGDDLDLVGFCEIDDYCHKILNKNFPGVPIYEDIKELDGKIIEEKYYVFYLKNNENKINIFFDKNTYDLVGWQTEDIYQNLVITFIYNLVKNSNIDQKLFILPKPY